MTSLDALLDGLAPGEPVAVVRDGPRMLAGVGAEEILRASGPAAFEALAGLESGWWAGFLAYDLGRSVERVPTIGDDDLGLPDVLLVRFAEQIEVDPTPTTPHRAQTLDDWTSSLDLDAWTAAVEQIHEHLLAGDCYQVNLTRRLRCDIPADPIGLFRALLARNPAPHAALFRADDVAVVSASPERFLRRDGRAIESRPIKGTGTDPRLLEASEKDRAENVMIVDLVRNDLGRVCEYGSIDVPELFEVEHHPGLVHLVSTIRGTLREDVSVADVIRATFPPASVTGCPKPRVLEIIERLEPVRRGVYCGAVGFIDTANDVIDLNVAIRTFTITRDATYLGVGGGIVSDSDARAEWEETELKARRLLAVARGSDLEEATHRNS